MLLQKGAVFFRAAFWRIAIISALLLVPCIWHKRIEAGDLPSHTYNAWLSQLIAQGKAPGLYIEPRWNNVLVDVALAKLGPVIGFATAEHILVALAVLIFFWGAFALITASNFSASMDVGSSNRDDCVRLDVLRGLLKLLLLGWLWILGGSVLLART
jgi:hypothetical protein